MKHRTEQLFLRHERGPIIMRAQPNVDLLSPIHIYHTNQPPDPNNRSTANTHSYLHTHISPLIFAYEERKAVCTEQVGLVGKELCQRRQHPRVLAHDGLHE